MILSGKEILAHMGRDILIEPFDPKKLIPTAIIWHCIMSYLSMKMMY